MSPSVRQVKLLELEFKQLEDIAIKRKSDAIKHLPGIEELIEIIWTNYAEHIKELFHPPIVKISFTPESHQKNKWTIFLDKLKCLNPTILNTIHIELFQILVQVLISKEKESRQFWTPVYKELSEKLSSLTKIDCVDSLTTSLNPLSLNQEEKSKFYMRSKNNPVNKNWLKTSSPSSIYTRVNKWEEDVTNQKMKKARKVRIYPNQDQKKILDSWISTSNYVYNKTVDLLNGNHPLDFIKLRDTLVTATTKKNNPMYNFFYSQISRLEKKLRIVEAMIEADSFFHINWFDQCEKINNRLKNLRIRLKSFEKTDNQRIQRWELETPKAIRSGAVADACKAMKTGFANLKAGNIFHFRMGFRKKKDRNKSLVLEKSLIKCDGKKIVITPTILKENSVFSIHHNFKIISDARLIKQKGRYFIIAMYDVEDIPKDMSKLRISGYDPGLRTFMTGFGTHSTSSIESPKRLLKRLNAKLDLLKSIRIRKKQLNKIERRKKNIIDELHWKSIHLMLADNDIVICGDIKSQNIVKQSKNKHVNRDFNDLKFYTFKQRLVYKAACLRKKVLLVNEAYTTKTCSRCGTINEIGSSKIFTCTHCSLLTDRDLNAAKNILMKGLLY